MFFELNGQQRMISVKNRKVAASVGARPKADVSNAAHVAAPMPGVVASIAVEAGKKVKAGDMLLTIEAMKMENTIQAHGPGTVREVLVTAGDQVENDQLLLTIDERNES